MIILRSAVTRPMQRAIRGLLIIAVVIFLSWIASSWINHEAQYMAKPETAKAFVQWWVSKALDYSPEAAEGRRQAKDWMLSAALTDFDQVFWTNSEIKEFVITDISDPIVKNQTLSCALQENGKTNETRRSITISS